MDNLAGQEKNSSLQSDYLTQQMQARYSSPYWQQPSKLFNTSDSIDWQLNVDLWKAMTIRRKIWATKWVTGWLPIGKNMKHWQQWDNNHCTICMDRSQPETATHLFKCSALSQQALKEEAVQLVQEHIYLLQDQILVAFSLMTMIFQVPSCSPGIPMITQAIEEQQEIGMEWTL